MNITEICETLTEKPELKQLFEMIQALPKEKQAEAVELATEYIENAKLKADFSEYATRQAITWLINTENNYNYMRLLAEAAEEAAGGNNEQAAAILAEDIKKYLNNANPLQDVNNLYADIMAQALYEIDYTQIAGVILDE